MDGSLIKRAATRRRLKRLKTVAGGMATVGILAGGAAWQRHHPRDPKGRFRDTPSLTPATQTQQKDVGSPPPAPAAPKTVPRTRASKIAVDARTISSREFREAYPHVAMNIRPRPSKGFGVSDCNDVRVAFHRFATLHPETAQRVQEITFGDTVNGVRVAGSLSTTRDGKFVVYLNPEIAAKQRYDVDRRRGETAGVVASVNHATVSAPMVVMYHELGHAVHVHGRMAGTYDGYGMVRESIRTIKDDPMLSDALNKNRRLAVMFKRLAPLPASERPADRSAPFKNFTVSRYALQDTSEFFAENFAIVMTQRHQHDDGFPRAHEDTERWIRELQSEARRFDRRSGGSIAKIAVDRIAERHGWMVVCRPFKGVWRPLPPR